MQDYLIKAVNFVRTFLHEVFTVGRDLTAPPIVAPSVAESPSAPQPKSEDQRWRETKAQLLEGTDLEKNMDGSLNANKKTTLSTLLDNFHNNMKLETSQYNQASNIATMHKVILPVTRTVFANMIANEIVGVQPLKGPIDQILTLRVQYADAISLISPNPFKSISYSGKSEAVSELESKISTLYEQYEILHAAEKPAESNRLSIQIIKEVVESKTVNLAARWTFEAACDGSIFDDSRKQIYVESEIIAAMAQEITAEYDQELLQTISAIAGEPTSIFNMSNIANKYDFVGDVHAALAILINRQANLIAARTRRGAGNWCVVSPTALTILQSASTSAFARTTEGVFEAPTNTKFVGTLNNAMRVYVNQYAADNTPVLVGYRGNDIDAGAFFCPLNLLSISNVSIDPTTFEPIVGFKARYGFHSLSNAAFSFGNVGIDTSNLTFI